MTWFSDSASQPQRSSPAVDVVLVGVRVVGRARLACRSAQFRRLLENGPAVSARPTAKVTFCAELGMKWPHIIHEPELGWFLLFLPAPLPSLVHLSCLCQEGQINKRKRGEKKRQEVLESLTEPPTASPPPLCPRSLSLGIAPCHALLCFLLHITNFLKTGLRI